MAKTTKIQWADATWNPFIGCTKVSPACDHCYAEGWAKRCGRDFNKVVRAATGTFHAPLSWKEPKRIFVCSLSDFFHPDIIRPDRHNAIHVMRRAPQHTYMLLTKRPENIKDMLAGTAWAEGLPDNVWVGVTAENQEQADKRIPILLQVPARVRFVSCEPLLGEVNLIPYLAGPKGQTVKFGCGWCETEEHVHGSQIGRQLCIECGQRVKRGPALNWVIVGGESGAGYKSKAMVPDWARALRDQCAEVKTPFMFKQWGEWGPVTFTFRGKAMGNSYVGKSKSGRLLDGKEHNGIPA